MFDIKNKIYLCSDTSLVRKWSRYLIFKEQNISTDTKMKYFPAHICSGQVDQRENYLIFGFVAYIHVG